MASYTPEHNDEHPPLHQIGTLLSCPPDYSTIAEFPPGTFLENLAVRHDGTILMSDMISGRIWYVDPRKLGETQETVELIHDFVSKDDRNSSQPDHDLNANGGGHEEKESHGSYPPTLAATAIIQAQRDIFYISTGVCGRAGTWSIWCLDMRFFTPKAHAVVVEGQEQDLTSARPILATDNDRSRVSITQLSPIPTATWLNGGTHIATGRNGLLLLAESFLGRIYSYDIETRKVDIWLDHALLKKITTRPAWPGINGLQDTRFGLYFTNSDRGIFGRITFRRGAYKAGKWNPVLPQAIQVLATGCCGDDFCTDRHGNLYVATNPMNTVLKLPRIVRWGTGDEEFYDLLPDPSSSKPVGKTRRHDHRYKHDEEATEPEPAREIVLGLHHSPGWSIPQVDPETTGPTAVALAGRSEGDLYVVTNGGMINPLDGVVRKAKLIRIDLTAWKTWKLEKYGRIGEEDSETDEEAEREAKEEADREAALGEVFEEQTQVGM